MTDIFKIALSSGYFMQENSPLHQKVYTLSLFTQSKTEMLPQKSL